MFQVSADCNCIRCLIAATWSLSVYVSLWEFFFFIYILGNESSIWNCNLLNFRKINFSICILYIEITLKKKIPKGLKTIINRNQNLIWYRVTDEKGNQNCVQTNLNGKRIWLKKICIFLSTYSPTLNVESNYWKFTLRKMNSSTKFANAFNQFRMNIKYRR